MPSLESQNQTPRFFDPAPLLPYLAQGWQVITPNSRLASRVRLSVVEALYVQNGKPIESPAIQSLKLWFDTLWQRALLCADEKAISYRLLTDEQELMVWQQIISRSAEATNLINAQATARDVMDARRRLWQWQIDPRGLDSFSFEHDCAFKWFNEFDQHCAKQRWLTREARNSYLTEQIVSRRLSVDTNVLLLGFAELTPRDQALMHVMSNCESLPMRQAAEQRDLISFTDSEEELLAAAYFINAHLENSTDRIALVVPNLTARRTEIVRVIQQVLQPEQLAVDCAWQLPPFNISAGESLGDLPIAHIAILILRLAYTQLQRAEWQALFASPYFSLVSDDKSFVVRLLTRLADTRSDVLKSSALRSVIQAIASTHTDIQQLIEVLLNVAAEQRQSAVKKSSSQWAEQFRNVLNALAWPGKRGLLSIDYQQYQQCQDGLDIFARADFVLQKLSAAEAIQQLDDLLKKQVFQPQSSDTRLQILGTLEAAGLQFDTVWLLGVDEMHWPPAAAPNAFLPLGLQIEQQMPRASAQRELDLASVLTEQLLSSSPHLIASYCSLQDEAHYQASQLLKNFSVKTREDFKTIQQCKTPLQQVKLSLDNIQVLYVDAGNAPQYQTQEQAPGGSRIINDQAQCPFRSFVANRLQGKSLESVGYAFDQREQGKLLHKALEEFWSAEAWGNTPTQAALKSLTTEECELRCEAAIAKALTIMTQSMLRRGVSFGAVLQSLEAQRVKARMLEWLEEEKNRPVFSVYSCEKSMLVNYADLSFTLYPDRIDQLADGGLMVIDYKTGLADKPSQWLGDRPENLQLPLYAVELAEPDKSVSGLAFAKIHAEKIAFDGLGVDEQTGLTSRYQLGGNKDNPPDWSIDSWQDLLTHWKTTIELLANEFCCGDATINPLKPPYTCNHCELKPVCRFHLDEFVAEEDAGDE